MRRTYLFASALVTALMLFSMPSGSEESARAQTQTNGNKYQYAVKYVCGRPQPTPGQPLVVASGTYFTAINVHNPLPKSSVSFKKKFVIALPRENPNGKISKFFDTGLKADAAYEIDCADIIQKLQAPPLPPSPFPNFVKGFVVIESPTELDVVAVYSAAGSTGQVETMHLERVPARPMQ